MQVNSIYSSASFNFVHFQSEVNLVKLILQFIQREFVSQTCKKYFKLNPSNTWILPFAIHSQSVLGKYFSGEVKFSP